MELHHISKFNHALRQEIYDDYTNSDNEQKLWDSIENACLGLLDDLSCEIDLVFGEVGDKKGSMNTIQQEITTPNKSCLKKRYDKSPVFKNTQSILFKSPKEFINQEETTTIDTITPYITKTMKIIPEWMAKWNLWVVEYIFEMVGSEYSLEVLTNKVFPEEGLEVVVWACQGIFLKIIVVELNL